MICRHRLVLCLLLFSLAACGPVEIGVGLAEVFSDDPPVDATAPQVEFQETGRAVIGAQVVSVDDRKFRVQINKSFDLLLFELEVTGPAKGVDANGDPIPFTAADLFENATTPESVPEFRQVIWTLKDPASFPEGKYTFKVTVVDGLGRRDETDPAEWLVDRTAPPPPINVRGSGPFGNGDTIVVTWQENTAEADPAQADPSGIDHYEIVLLPNPGGIHDNVAMPDPMLPAGTTLPVELDTRPTVPTVAVVVVKERCTDYRLAMIAVDGAANRSIVSDGGTILVLEPCPQNGWRADPPSDEVKKNVDAATLKQGNSHPTLRSRTQLRVGAKRRSAIQDADRTDSSSDSAVSPASREAVFFGPSGFSVFPTDQNGALTPNSSFFETKEIPDVVSAAVLDFNADRILDVAVASGTTGEIGLYRGGGTKGRWDGTFQFVTTTFRLPAGTTPRELIPSDLNKDRYEDVLLIADSATESTLHSLLGSGNDGSGTGDLGANVRTRDTGVNLNDRAAATATGAIAFGRFNGDTYDDVAVVDGTVVRVLFGAGHPGTDATQPNLPNGEFDASRLIAPEGGPEFVAAGDFNRDRLEDLVTSNRDGSVSVIQSRDTQAVLAANGGDFELPRNFAVGTRAGQVKVGDFTSDGIPDVLVAGSRPGFVSLLRGAGAGGTWDGSFTLEHINAGIDVVELDLTDRDGDGAFEMTVFDGKGGTGFLAPDLFQPLAKATFTQGALLPTFHPVSTVALADVNGDTLLDVLAGGEHTSTGTYSIFEGRFRVDDVNGQPVVATVSDGSFGPALSLGGAESGIFSILPADFNRDGVPDVVLSSADGVDVQFGLFSKIEQRYSFATDTFRRFASTATVRGDFNRDGVHDVASLGGGAVRILLGRNVEGRTDGRHLFDDRTVLDLYGGARSAIDCTVADLGPVYGAFGEGLRFDLTGVGVAADFAAGDFDDDGGLDLIVSDESPRGLAILRNYGRDCGLANTIPAVLPDRPGIGVFEPAKHYPLPFVPSRLLLSDFNEDGVLDVVVLAKDASAAAEAFCVAIGKRTGPAGVGLGDFDFEAPVPYQAGSKSLAVAAGDFNKDDILDVAVLDADGFVYVLIGDGVDGVGNGKFASFSKAATGLTDVSSLAVGDFNSDGIPDLAVGGKEGVRILLGDRA